MFYNLGSVIVNLDYVQAIGWKKESGKGKIIFAMSSGLPIESVFNDFKELTKEYNRLKFYLVEKERLKNGS